MGHDRKNRSYFSCPIVIFLVIVIYVASSGPAFYLWVVLGQPGELQTLLAYTYAPLAFLPGPLEQGLTEYVQWWCELGGTRL